MFKLIFKGLAHHSGEISGLIGKAGVAIGSAAILEYLVIVLAVLNVFKGVLILFGLALWRAKWGALSEEVARVTAFGAGAYTLFDWTSWEITVMRVVSALLLGSIFTVLYTFLRAWLSPAGEKHVSSG
jgi:hypothetical protein